MFRDSVLPLLLRDFPPLIPSACRTYKTTGLGESYLEERVAKPLDHLVSEGLEIGYCARVGEVDLRLIVRGPNCASILQQADAIVQPLLGPIIYGYDSDQLDAAIVRLLAERRKTLALAESCTGGYIANRITNISGASAVLLAGFVTYSNEAKQKFLGVKRETLEANGAVSEPVAREMAAGALAQTGADFALSVTGIAGPTGGTPEKPVGTVFIGLTHGTKVKVLKQLNQYDRETFKYLTSQQALEMLRRAILDLEP